MNDIAHRRSVLRIEQAARSLLRDVGPGSEGLHAGDLVASIGQGRDQRMDVILAGEALHSGLGYVVLLQRLAVMVPARLTKVVGGQPPRPDQRRPG